MPSKLLFIPPHPPLPLPEDGVVVIGRSRDAALRLPDPDTSRRHAKIVCRVETCTLHDLGSTNGTYVNGERVDERALAAGDRIGIGDNEITFCEIGGLDGADGAGTDDGAATRLLEEPARTEAFQGDLAQIPPFAVVQILEMGRKTGVLELDSAGSCGRLWFQGGDPVHAETQGQLGFDAAISLVHASKGRFRFEPTLEPPQRTIEASVTQLLLEASRVLDELGSTS